LFLPVVLISCCFCCFGLFLSLLLFALSGESLLDLALSGRRVDGLGGAEDAAAGRGRLGLRV
jgi:hypothetical protein